MAEPPLRSTPDPAGAPAAGHRPSDGHRPEDRHQPEDEHRPSDGRLPEGEYLPEGEHRPSDEHWVVRDPRSDDLARNKPGAAARARGRELRREHPLLTTAADLLGIRTTARSFAIGARGERVVGRKLERWAARYGWHILHAVPVGQRGTDIDHVVIARFGVVTINTKATSTAVWVGDFGMTVGGRRVDHIRKSRAEAARARKLLIRAVGASVPVQSAIVFVGARRFTMVRGGPADVAVLRSPRALRRWLRKQSPVLGLDQVAAIYDAARQPASWQARRARPR